MKVVMTGGGTGGHVNPALAIAAAIEKRDPGALIYYVGTPNGIENKLVPGKYPMYHVSIQGLRRKITLSNIKTLFLTVTSFGKAKKILKEIKPDLVVGTGGYVSWPVVRAASSLGIPCALHECNAVPGLAVRMLESKVDVIFTNFKNTASLLSKAKRTVWTGTPVRSEIYDAKKDAAREKLGIKGKYRKFVLSFGGSLGADTLNREMLLLMKEYFTQNPDICCVHAAGGRNFEKTVAEFRALGLSEFPNITLVDYIYDMPERLAACDLVICRSGAMTISELAAAGKASVLIPSPNVTDDQQTKNAALLEKEGAAVMIKEDDLYPGKLAGVVSDLLDNERQMADMCRAIKKFEMSNSEQIIYDELIGICERKSKT